LGKGLGILLFSADEKGANRFRDIQLKNRQNTTKKYFKAKKAATIAHNSSSKPFFRTVLGFNSRIETA